MIRMEPAPFQDKHIIQAGAWNRKNYSISLDEYNWVTITHGISVPPPWHPS